MPTRPSAVAATGARPVGIFMLGMHRSGTSVLTRILNLLGCSLPGELLGANASNPSGHWESARAIEINDSLLAELGRSWDDIRELPEDWMERPEAKAAKLQIRALLDWEFSGKRLWLLKEPRLCRLAPLWLQVAQEMDIDIRVILPIRHPSEVSYSLTRRDGIAAGRTQLLWCRHLLEAERASRGLPRVLVDFSAVTTDWRGQVERIAAALGIDWPNKSSKVFKQIDGFIDPELRHADASGKREQLTERVPLAEPVARLYQEILEATGDEVWEVIARAAESIERNASLFAPAIEDLARQVERKQKRAATMNAVLSDKLAEGGVRLLNEGEVQQLLQGVSTILGRADEIGPLTVELIRQIEAQRQEIRSSTSVISAENSNLFQKLDQSGPLLAALVNQVEAQRHELLGQQHPLLVDLARQIQEQRSELQGVAESVTAENRGTRAKIDQANPNPLVVELIRQVQDQRAAIDAIREAFVAQEQLRLRSQMHEQDRIVYAETEAALRSQLELSQAQLQARQEELDFLRSQLQYLGREHSRELAVQAARIEELLNSRSWRLAAPFRRLSRMFRREPRAAADKNGFLKSVYLALPLSWSTRLRMKSAAFKLLGPLIRDTDAYRRWQSQQPRQAPLLEGGGGLKRQPEAAAEVTRQQPARIEPEYVPLAPDAVDADELRAKLIAFYLPQFHPIPENDEWWGRGFTEWTNVSKAVPQFKGHGVPHLPGELGFYDLRLPEVMQRQIELARQYGVHGFCFHYYWFDGRRILERPLNQFLDNPEFDFPFCICWANENWTRRWDGHENDVLLGQNHSPESDLRFIQDAEPILRDPRYIRIGGKPLLVVYRPSLLPDCAKTVERWREYCRDAGIGEIMLAMVQFDVEDPRPLGFDVALEFPPHKLARNLPSINATLEALDPGFRGYVVDYHAVVERSINWPVPEYDMIRGVFPGWDNEARKPQQGYVFAHSSPEGYRDWLRHSVDYAREHPVAGEALVFVNAWNEWAEGAYLEPDRRHGYAYLQATRDALTPPSRDRHGDDVPANPSSRSADRLDSLPAPMSDRRVVVVSHDAHPHGAQYLSLHLCREIAHVLGCQVDVVLLGDGVLEADFQQAATVHLLHCRGGTVAGAELARKLRAGGADIAIVNTTVSGLFASDLGAAGFKLVSLVHELPGVIESYGLRAHAQHIARDADLVVFAADAVREGFEKFATLDPARTRIRTQGNYKHNRHQSAGSIAAARGELRRRLGIAEDTLIVLSVGYADLRKGVDLFVSVGERLIHADPRVHMLWLGHLDLALEEELRAQIRATGVERHFHFPGRDSDTDVYYAGSDLYALTSREDPFPTVIMEAFDVGVPVVGFTSAGGFEELLGRAGGRLAPGFDVDAYALECSKLLADDALRQALGREGKAIVDTEFSFTDYVHDLLGYLGVQVPRVSVVVPNYNYARYLPERLRSIAGQTLPPYEIIVLDDASSDESMAVLGGLAGSIPLRVITNEKNSGSVFRQWQKGVAAARGDYVWIAEADDLSDPGFLRTVMAAFQLPEVVMSYCQSRQIDEHGKQLAPDYLDYVADFGAERWREPFVADLSEELDHGLAVKNTIPNVSAVVFRRAELAAVLDRCSDEISGFRIAGDWLTYMHVLAAGAVAFQPAALNLHRRHAGGVTIGADHRPHLEEVLRVQAWIAERFELQGHTVEAAARYIEFLKVYFGLDAART